MGWRSRIPAPDVDRALTHVAGDRDRVLDLLRAWSIVVVVAGHALMAVVMWRDGIPRLGNTLATYGWLHPATWFLQVLPIFFMVGATANGHSWHSAQRRKERYAVWVWHRTQRLLRPVIAYVAVMALVGFSAGGLGDPRTAEPLLQLTTQLLWFLGAYLWVMALTPVLVRLGNGHTWIAVAVLLSVVGAVDVVRFGLDGSPAWGLVNFLTVWMLAGVLGVRLGRPLQRRLAAAILLGALATNLLLVAYADYPVSLVGMPGAEVSNMDPPTIVLLVHCVALFALVVLLRPLLERWVQRPRVWRATVAVNMLMMSVYLWHLPVLTALTWAEHLLGLERPMRWVPPIGPSPLAGFWPWTIVHLALFGVLLLLVLRVVWVLEYTRLPWWDAELAPRPPAPAWLAALGVALAGVGISVISATGLTGFPVRVIEYEGVPFNGGVAVALLAVGIALIRRGAAPKL